MLRAVIFDLDGLLIDSEGLHCRAWQRILAEIGVPVSEAEYHDHWIRAGLGVGEYMERRGLRHNPDELRVRKFAVYRELVDRELRPMPGALELLGVLHRRVPLGLATSSLGFTVEAVFGKIAVGGFFDVIATFESVPRAKPHPDIFLHVAERLGADPRDCVALEDAEKGVVAAHAAGMAVVAAVPNAQTRTNDFSRATLVIDSLARVTPALLESLAGEKGADHGG